VASGSKPTQNGGHPLSDVRFDLLVDAVEEYAIFMLDPLGNVSTWNSGAHRIKQYEADEIVGRHFSVFYSTEDIRAGKPERELQEAIDKGFCRDEGWRIRKDGTRFWANVVITSMTDADGRLQGFAKITRDETDRRVAQEQSRQLELLMDRERIADSLRDTIVHRLFEAGLIMEGLLQLVRDPIAVQRIEKAVSVLDETLKQIRVAVLDLKVRLAPRASGPK